MGYFDQRNLKPKIKTANDAERERREQREEQRGSNTEMIEMEKRSWEKIQEILQDQMEDVQTFVKTPTNCENCPRDETFALSLKVADIMSRNIATVNFDDTLLTVKGIYSQVRFHHLPVVDEDYCLIGIVTDRDFLASVSPYAGTVNEQTRDIQSLKRRVGLIMTRNPSTIAPTANVVEAIRMMNSYRVSALPVIEGPRKKLVGIMTWKDIVRAFAPAAFNSIRDSSRLKTGVNIRPKTTESGRFIPYDGDCS